MTLDAALHDSVVRLYLAIIGGLLIFAGVVLAILRFGLRKNVGSVITIYVSWLVLVPVAIGCVVLGRVPFILAVVVASLLGFKEFARATGLYADWPMTIVGYLGILTIGASSLLLDPGDHSPGWFGFFMATPVFVIAAILVVPILRNLVTGQLQKLSLTIVGFVYIGWMFGHLGFLANSNHAYAYILYLLLAVELNDIAAYLFGKAFGRHKLRSNISPNKTWEGALGALAFAMVLPWLLRGTLPHFETKHLLWTGAIVGIGGQLGDLSISIIKRDVGIKDMGGIIPGHGGVLDRIDSLIYTVPLFFHMVNYYFYVKPL
jgi:phosphatidate cytidylyltransferase